MRPDLLLTDWKSLVGKDRRRIHHEVADWKDPFERDSPCVIGGFGDSRFCGRHRMVSDVVVIRRGSEAQELARRGGFGSGRGQTWEWMVRQCHVAVLLLACRLRIRLVLVVHVLGFAAVWPTYSLYKPSRPERFQPAAMGSRRFLCLGARERLWLRDWQVGQGGGHARWGITQWTLLGRFSCRVIPMSLFRICRLGSRVRGGSAKRGLRR